MTETTEPTAPQVRLLRIQEVAAEVGLTARSVRYYEELGLLRPAARSEGDYRLYDATDVERLRFIKGLRDDAGFSLAEVAQMLEDEEARERGHAAYHATSDPDERAQILRDRLARFDHQIEMLRTKIGRLTTMVEETEARRARTAIKLDDLSAADGSAADGSAADGSAADGSAADGSAADGSAADGSASVGSASDGSAADGSAADGSAADGSAAVKPRGAR
jgi:MerR family transcriptional regulator, repressor of the yfmOP operon